MFVRGKPFQPSLMFESKAGTYLSREIFTILQDLPANIRQDWKSLPGTNTLAYCKDSYGTSVKSFITLFMAEKEASLYNAVLNVIFLLC